MHERGENDSKIEDLSHDCSFTDMSYVSPLDSEALNVCRLLGSRSIAAVAWLYMQEESFQPMRTYWIGNIEGLICTSNKERKRDDVDWRGKG